MPANQTVTAHLNSNAGMANVSRLTFATPFAHRMNVVSMVDAWLMTFADSVKKTWCVDWTQANASTVYLTRIAAPGSSVRQPIINA